jgi:hypothetical protein
MPGEGEEPARRGRPFRSRLAMATTTPLWSKPTRNYAMLALEGEGLTVRVSDEPVPAGCDVAELARAAAGRWAHAPGYAERSLEPATVLGFGGGLERRLVCEVGGAPAQWLERYVAVEGHGLVVTAHERARAVADGLAIGRPALDPQRFYEPAFTAELPDGWTAVDRVELVRVESSHRVIAESRPVALGTSGQHWADACAGRLGAAPVATDRGRLFGMGEAVVNTFRSDDSGAPTLTRIWTTIVDGRGYSVSITLPEQDRYGFKLLVAHAALAGQPRVSLGGLAALVDPAGAPT